MDISFVYCEGAHDLAFIKKVLEANTAVTKFTGKVNQLPPVLEGLITQGFSNSPVSNIRIDKQYRPFVPHVVFKKNEIDKYILLYSLGGKTRLQDAIKSIKISPSLEKVISGNITHSFIIDADYLNDALGGIIETNKYLQRTLEVISDFQFDCSSKINSFSIGRTSVNSYVITGVCGQEGALEDLLLATILKADLLSAAEAFHIASNEIETGLPFTIGRSKPIKARLGAYTQLFEPGSSLAVGIASNYMVNPDGLNQKPFAIDIYSLVI